MVRPTRRRLLRRAPLALVLAASLLLAGCVQYTASAIPDTLLDGATQNGWQFFANEPPDGPVSKDFGMVQQWAKLYRDTGEQRGGHPASLTVISFKVAFTTPDRDELVDRVQQLVAQEAEEQGIRLEAGADREPRTTAAGDDAVTFRYQGEAGDSAFFSRQADVEVAGAVWNCAEGGRNTVVVVALAQVNERTAGGFVEDPDDRNWLELWEDATPNSGGDDGGLMMHATCG